MAYHPQQHKMAQSTSSEDSSDDNSTSSTDAHTEFRSERSISQQKSFHISSLPNDSTTTLLINDPLKRNPIPEPVPQPPSLAPNDFQQLKQRAIPQFHPQNNAKLVMMNPLQTVQQSSQSSRVLNPSFNVNILQHMQQQSASMRAMPLPLPPMNTTPSIIPTNYAQQMQQESMSMRAFPQNQLHQMQQQSMSMRSMNNPSYQQPIQPMPPSPQSIQQQSQSVRTFNNNVSPNAIQQMQQQSMSVRVVNDEEIDRKWQNKIDELQRENKHLLQSHLDIEQKYKTQLGDKQKQIDRLHQTNKSLQFESGLQMTSTNATLPSYHQSPTLRPQKVPIGDSLIPKHNKNAEPGPFPLNELPMPRTVDKSDETKSCSLCKVLFGIFFAVLSILCVLTAWKLDEITRNNTDFGTLVCGRNIQYLCSPNIEQCKDTVFFGYNFNLNNLNITKIIDFDMECNTGLNSDACVQITAGKLWRNASFVCVGIGILGLLFLIAPCIRNIASAVFIVSGISTVVAFGGYLIMSNGKTCWDVDHTEVHMAASCWLDIAALVLFMITSIVTIGVNRETK